MQKKKKMQVFKLQPMLAWRQLKETYRLVNSQMKR